MKHFTLAVIVIISTTLTSLILSKSIFLSFKNPNTRSKKQSSPLLREISSTLKPVPQTFTSKKVTKHPSKTVPLPTNPKSKNSLLNKQYQNLLKTETCYKIEGSCAFPQTDPKSEFFAIGQKLKRDLLKVLSLVENQQLKSPVISEIARHFMQTPDGHVKEAALHLLASQETSTQNLQSLLNDIINYHDAKLIHQALLELERYLGNEDEEVLIHQSLAKALTHGSPFVANEISRYLSPFINETSLAFYQQVLSHLSLGSQIHQQVFNAIREYERQQKAA